MLADVVCIIKITEKSSFLCKSSLALGKEPVSYIYLTRTGCSVSSSPLGIALLSLFTLNVATKSPPIYPIPVEWVIIWQPQPCFHYFRYGFHSEFEDCMGNRVTGKMPIKTLSQSTFLTARCLLL